MTYTPLGLTASRLFLCCGRLPPVSTSFPQDNSSFSFLLIIGSDIFLYSKINYNLVFQTSYWILPYKCRITPLNSPPYLDIFAQIDITHSYQGLSTLFLLPMPKSRTPPWLYGVYMIILWLHHACITLTKSSVHPLHGVHMFNFMIPPG